MRILRNKEGFSYILVCVIILVAMMLIFVGLQYRYIFYTINSQKESVQLSLDSLVTKSAVEYYNALKQGDAYDGYIDRAELRANAYSALGFGNTGTQKITEERDSIIVYKMSRPAVIDVSDGGFGLQVRYNLSVPFEMFGKYITDIRVTVEITSKYIEK